MTKGRLSIMNDDHGANKLVKGALLLSLAGFISKILSASYRIPLQNLTGDIGFYIYQQVYPILGIVIVLSLYGFPQAVSKATAELTARGEEISTKNFVLPIGFIIFIICLFFFFVLFLFAPFIADRAGDMQLEKAYQTAAFTFLFIPLLALFRGVLQGKGSMEPTAYSQVGEQLFRVVLIILAALSVAVWDNDMYMIGQAAGIASIVGLIVATMISGYFIITRKPFGTSVFRTPWKYYIKIMITLGLIASLNHMVLLVMQFADAFTLIPGLLENGYSKLEAMEAKGVFDRGQPLIQLGAVLGSSFALALMPTISKKKLKETPAPFYEQVSGAILVSFYLGIGATVGLIALFPEVNQLLYQNSQGTRELQILSLSVILCSLSITSASILQGLGYVKHTAAFIFISFIIKWTLNYILVPLVGITGSAISTVAALAFLCTVIYIALKRRLPLLQIRTKINGKTLITANIVMIIFIVVMKAFLLTFVSTRLELLLFVSVVVIAGAMIYLMTLIRGRSFTKQEIEMLPFASKLIHIHKERKE